MSRDVAVMYEGAEITTIEGLLSTVRCVAAAGAATLSSVLRTILRLRIDSARIALVFGAESQLGRLGEIV